MRASAIRYGLWTVLGVAQFLHCCGCGATPVTPKTCSEGDAAQAWPHFVRELETALRQGALGSRRLCATPEDVSAVLETHSHTGAQIVSGGAAFAFRRPGVALEDRLQAIGFDMPTELAGRYSQVSSALELATQEDVRAIADQLESLGMRVRLRLEPTGRVSQQWIKSHGIGWRSGVFRCGSETAAQALAIRGALYRAGRWVLMGEIGLVGGS